jgi:hypothetical protein
MYKKTRSKTFLLFLERVVSAPASKILFFFVSGNILQMGVFTL